jgi:hypothetical protein
MLLMNMLWGLCLLSSTAAGMRPQRLDVPYLVARQNDTLGNTTLGNSTGNSTGNATIPDIPYLCGIPAPGASE